MASLSTRPHLSIIPIELVTAICACQQPNRGADVGSDHDLITAKIQMKLKSLGKKKTNQARELDMLKIEHVQKRRMGESKGYSHKHISTGDRCQEELHQGAVDEPGHLECN
jgi:hypothetical protein